MTTPTPEEQRYHWSEGNKYALEAMKALLWLNGGSAAALLTVFGGSHQHPVTPDLGHAIASFAAGAAFSVFMFIWAYRTELRYGRKGIYENSQWVNRGAYAVMLAALGLFLFGLLCAYDAVTTALSSG
jgi:hypothetical protein